MATMEMTYQEIGGLLYPDLGMEALQERTMASIGKYGLLAMNYLKDNMIDRYRTLVRFGMLEEKMREVDEEANELLEQLTEHYLKGNRPENPNSTMEMWSLREQAKRQAEEVVLVQVVNRFH